MNSPAILLADLDVLALDCQTTGATPKAGRLLEVGWAVTRPSAGQPVVPETYLIRSSSEEDLSPAIARLTGLQAEDMARARSARRVWRRMAQTAWEVAHRSGGTCIAVIHYARFEKAFLEYWHAASAPKRPFPFETLCTHELARKLLPGLPRCGLRALAGYFGLRLPSVKRCAPHVVATALIWDRLVGLLADMGIDDLSGLKQWMRSTPKPGRQPRVYPMPPHLPRRAPDRPGVYRFRRSNGDLLYVGKAKSLKHRLGSYFQQRRHSEHILEMLTQAVDLDYAVTATALEAALMEVEDIHRMRPEYNIHLQTGGQVPVFSTRDLLTLGDTAGGERPMGPFPSRKALQPLSAIIRFLLCPATGPAVDEAAIAAAFDRPADAMPAADVFYEGLALFRRQNDLPQKATALARRLLLYGAVWWRRVREAEREAKTESEPEDAVQTDWQPMDVVKLLEGVTRHGALLARRGRWFTLLCEATLAWEMAPGGDLAAVAVRGGRVAVTTPPCHPDALPPPETHSRTPHERHTCFDASTYLRMRVLSTEIRRLVAEGRRVWIGLRPGVVIDRDALKRLFFWI